MAGPRAAAWLTLVCTVSLAGCAAEPAGELVVDLGPAQAPSESDLVSGDRGGIKGIVTDESLLPVANATVLLEGAGTDAMGFAEATTGLDGGFAFGFLAPQAYRVTVSQDLYASSSHLVQVVAGALARLDVQLGAVPSAEPYVELLIHDGIAGCSVGAVWLTLGGPCGAAEYKTQFPLAFAATWQYTVVEADWKTSNALWMFVDLDDDATCLNPGAPCPGSIIGTAPIRVDGAPDSAHGTDRFQHGDISYPPGGEDLPVWLNVADFDMFYNEINAYGKPVCDLNGYCGGAGATLEIRFTTYSSIFHNALPPAVDLYSALPDE